MIRASRASFRAVDSVQLVLHVNVQQEGITSKVDTDLGYRNGQVVYMHDVISGEGVDEYDYKENLLVADDLYVLTSDDTWYVRSPWNQGIPADSPSADLSDLNSYYENSLAPYIKSLESKGTEAIDGETFLRYEASFEPPDSPAGDASLWLHEETFLPRKLEISVGDESTAIAMTMEFLRYGLPPQPPDVPSGALPWRDLELPKAPCTGDAFAACLAAQTELGGIAVDSCSGAGQRICLVPLGNVDAGLMRYFVDYYREHYNLAVQVLTPQAVSDQIVDSQRQQVDASTLMDLMTSAFPESLADRQIVLVGVTPIDLFDKDSTYRYIFSRKGTPQNPRGVISTFRMDPRTYAEAADETLLYARSRKMLTKYIGLLYYGLSPSDDPSSALFDSIGGPADLDAMGDDLPVDVR
ncbi:MAG: hypothetical protein WEB04_08420 [Dehalococcoidia bacterium]